jgi:energy-coupling factor transport system permease protein
MPDGGRQGDFLVKGSSPPDPRCVFALAAYLSLFAVFTQTLWLMAALLAMTVITAQFMRVGLLRFLRHLKRLCQVIIIVALLQSIFSPSGAVWIQLGNIALLTSGGLEKGLVVLGRLLILILSGSLFTLHSARELIQGMIQLRLPYEIAYMISVGVRFIPMMGEELRDSLTALALRGVDIENLPIRSRLKVYTYLLLPMVAGSLHNARELAMSMETRGFGAYPGRTSYFELIIKRTDYVILAATALMALLTGYVLIYII